MRYHPWLTLSVGLILGVSFGAVFILFWNKTQVTTDLKNDPIPGSYAPDFELDSLANGRIHLKKILGKPILINFWATWCSPCLIEMPIIQDVYEQVPGQFDVLAINADESVDRVKQYISDLDVSFPVLLDPAGLVQNLYRIRGYPTTYFIDDKGIIRFQHIGSLSEEQLMNYLAQLGVKQ